MKNPETTWTIHNNRKMRNRQEKLNQPEWKQSKQPAIIYNNLKQTQQNRPPETKNRADKLKLTKNSPQQPRDPKTIYNKLTEPKTTPSNFKNNLEQRIHNVQHPKTYLNNLKLLKMTHHDPNT